MRAVWLAEVSGRPTLTPVSRRSLIFSCDKVRAQLLPDPSIGPKALPMGIITGQLKATNKQYTRWMQIAPSFFVGLANQRYVFVGLKGVAKDRESADYYWHYGW